MAPASASSGSVARTDPVGTSSRNVSDTIAYSAAAVALALLLVAVARPIATDDAWWHLALGRAFAREGPRLADDPLLFTAVGPASSASWLSDLALAGVLDRSGFAGLRAAHVVCAAAILALAAALLRREGASGPVAALAMVGFATLAAYRLFQLRPDLATVLAVLLLYAYVLRPRSGPTPRRVALCAIGMAVWANLHAGFLLGPILVGVALLGVAAPALVGDVSAADRLRIRRLAVCLAAGSLATLANPRGLQPHRAWLASGHRSPDLSLISDEWARLDLFSWPQGPEPPTAAGWLWVWALLFGTIGASALAVVRAHRRRGQPSPTVVSPEIDPALVALAWAGLAAMWVAVRFTWLGLFPLLLLVQTCAHTRGPSWMRWLPGVLGPAALWGFVGIGPWPRLADVLRPSWEAFRQPYAAEKYPVDAVWLIRDAGLEGRLFTNYSIGGYAGFWLAPEIRTFVNGSLNVAPATMDAYRAITGRRAGAEGASFLDSLDRLELDLFLGTGMPEGPRYTAAHLERTPGWTLVFRNATSALYLRRRDDSANLQRVSDYYARERIPFDPERGFDVGRVVREQPGWAIRHHLIPERYATLVRQSIDPGNPRARLQASIELASFDAILGRYDEALEREAQMGAQGPASVGPRRRIVWALLRSGRHEEARAQAESLAGAAQRDPLARATFRLARALPTLSTERAESRIRKLPLLSHRQARALEDLLEMPRARER